MVAVDIETYNEFSDWFVESPNVRIALLTKTKGPLSVFFGSTASDFCYDIGELMNIIRKENIDLILTVELFSFLSKQASVICKRLSLPHVVIVWENISSHPFYHLPPFRNNTEIVKKNVDRIIAVTRKAKDSLSALNVPREKVAMVYPGVSIDKFRPRPINKKFSLLFVGGLEKHKGFQIVLKAFMDLSRMHENLTLGVVGNGSLRNRLASIRRRYGAKVEYLGKVQHSCIHLIYPMGTIFCFPNLKQKVLGLIPIREEQFGFSLVEAMACGLPAVAAKNGSTEELVGQIGTFEENKVGEFERIVEAFLSDTNLQKMVSMRNRRLAEEKFDARKQSLLFEKTLLEDYV